MINSIQLIGLYTLIRREVVRMFRISTQVFLPPIITTLLYFMIFGEIIGHRVGAIDGISYPTFIAPGLLMMSVITNAYSNVSSSLFSVRFQKSIEEMLVSPLNNSYILLGFCLGGIIRGLIVGILIYFIAFFFTDIDFYHLPNTLIIVFLVSTLFSLAGFTNAMVARNFDDVAIIPTFVLAPLSYLGGVFYSIQMLSPFWQKLTYLNPIFYMVNALRAAMINKPEVPVITAIIIICIMILGLFGINMYMLKKGIGIRD
tara:strand:- start:780 stop:1553 length:774 start_codon:yes stop_codon:yes gene_type:complete